MIKPRIGSVLVVKTMDKEGFLGSDIGKPKAGYFRDLLDLVGTKVVVVGHSEFNLYCEVEGGSRYYFSPNWLVTKAFKGNTK